MAATTTGKVIFMTGATGYIGSVVTEFAVAQGYAVRGLSRSEKGDEKLRKLGATPVRGDLRAFDVLQSQAAQADIVMHLADSFFDASEPKGYDEVIRIDNAAVDAMAAGVKGTNKPLIVTSGTLVAAPDPNGNETNEESPEDTSPFVERVKWERHALKQFNDNRVRVIVLRLAPYIYGRGGSGVAIFLKMALEGKEATYVEDGQWRTSSVHVDDTARLYLLAAEKAEAGDVFNVASSTTITSKQIAEAIGTVLDLPAVSKTQDEAAERFGPFLSKFLTSACRASSAKAVKVLGWEPREIGLLEDIEKGSYKSLAKNLKSSSS